MSRSPGIIHHANREDEATGRGYAAVKFTNLCGQPGEIEMAREDAYDPKSLLRELLRLNASLPVDRKKAKRELRNAFDIPPEFLQLYCGCTGWRPGAFVAPPGVIEIQNSRARRRALLPPKSLTSALRARGPGGSLEAWQAVADICGQSDLGQTLLCASLAAPLLRVMGRKTFGIHIAGAAGLGVEELLAAAASISHAPGLAEPANWRDPRAAAAEQCRLHNDLILPIELGPLPERRFYAAFRSAVVAVLESRREFRFGSSGFEASGRGSCNHSIFLSWAPHSINHYAGRAKCKRDAREHEACLHADAVRRGPTVLDRPHPERSDRESLITLRQACSANYGVALGPVIRFVMQDLDRSKQQIEHYSKTFLRRNEEDRGFDAFDTTMGNIALIYAAGCLAVDAGVLPYDKDDLGGAVRTCLNGSVSSLACITHPDSCKAWPD